MTSRETQFAATPREPEAGLDSDTPEVASGMDPGGRAALPEIAEVYQLHADFVWKSLQRLGLSPPEIEDAFQDVFVVVHRKLAEFCGGSQLTTWIFGICLRVVKEHRRRFARRRETDLAEPESVDVDNPELQVQRRRANEKLASILDSMSGDQRAVFVMFEIEGLSCLQIGEGMGIPVGTVYSRLHTARQRFYEECGGTQDSAASKARPSISQSQSVGGRSHVR